jgi:hypothetical protein
LATTDGERVRIEIGFDGGGSLAALVQSATAEELEGALENGRGGSLPIDADDGRYTIVLARVTYLKRFARESRVGFGSG